MKATIALTSMVALASSATAQYIGLISARSGSPIHLQEVTANGQQLWIGKPTASYCPVASVGKKNCPKGTDTNYAYNNGGLSMGAVVPGGQLVYIEPVHGLVQYTQAHSAAYPPGSKLGGWVLTEGQSFGTLSHGQGLLACSIHGDANTGPWKVHAALKGLTFGANCLGFDALTSNMTKPDAWQYT